MNPLVALKGFVSTCLLIFSIVLIMALIANKQTGLSSDASPGAAYALIWIAILWLTMIEGGQGSLVGLAPVNKELYKNSHPIAYKSTSITNKGDNLDRYLLGRQLMVVLVVFCVNISGGPVADAELWGLPQWVIDTFFTVGFAMILFTCMVGQLNSQVNASLCMLDYIDNYFALFTLWVAMAIEFSGLLHASYLIQQLVGWLAGKPIESKEPPRSMFQSLFFWVRCLGSLAVLVLCFIVTIGALFQGKTTMWEGVPPGVSIVVFFILMSVVGMLEGMQIAFFAVAKLTPEERGSSLFAKKTCDLLFKGEGNNLPGFMIGRQLTVVSCMFFVARVTSVSMDDGEENLFGVSDGLQSLFNTGLLGALALTIVGSIAWQLVASAFPLAFLANPITYYLLQICLFLEATGIASGSWVLAAVHKRIAGFQRDEVYIGTAQERAKKQMEDDDTNLQVGAGHLVKLPGFRDHAPRSLQKLLARDPAVAEYLKKALTDVESQKSDGAPAIAKSSSNDAEVYTEAFYKKN
jgi:silicon transporter